MSYRIDKYVHAVRLAKTRSQSALAVSKGKIRVNNETVKPSREINVGDEIQIIRHTATFTFRIIQLLEKRVGAKLVDQYIIDLTPEEEREKLLTYQQSQSTYRDNGTGKPTKKDRRNLGDFLNDWE